MEEVYTPNGCCLLIKLDFDLIRSLELEVDIEEVIQGILRHKKAKVKSE